MNNQPITSNMTATGSAPAASAVNPTAVSPTAVNPAAVNPAPASGTSGDGMSIASFVFGLISVIFLPLGTIPGFLGFVLSLDAKKRGSRHSLLSAGRVLSIIGMVAVPALYLLSLLLAMFAAIMSAIILL